MSSVTNVKGEYVNGNLVYTLGNGAKVIFKDYQGNTIMEIGQTQVDSNVLISFPSSTVEP
jgi:hypothetical protein